MKKINSDYVLILTGWVVGDAVVHWMSGRRGVAIVSSIVALIGFYAIFIKDELA